MAKNWYGVREGTNPHGDGEDVPGGVLYTSWPQCQRATSGVTAVTYKGFYDRSDALEWLSGQTFRTDLSPDEYGGHIVYTDGSGSEKTDKASWACALFDNSSGVEELMEVRSGVLPAVDPNKANIIAEVTAGIEAVRLAHKLTEIYDNRRILIVHDYVGVHGYAEGDFDPSKHLKLERWHEVAQENQDLIAGFYHVPGHTGVRGNEIADVAAWNTRMLAESRGRVQPKL